MLLVEEEYSLNWFYNLTLCPYDKQLIELSLLTQKDIVYIDEYHKRVWEELSPKLQERRPVDFGLAQKGYFALENMIAKACYKKKGEGYLGKWAFNISWMAYEFTIIFLFEICYLSFVLIIYSKVGRDRADEDMPYLLTDR